MQRTHFPKQEQPPLPCTSMADEPLELSPFEVKILKGAPGCGKTSHLIKEMAATRGRYLLASPRLALIDERHCDLRKAAEKAGTEPILRLIHNENTGRLSVLKALQAAAAEFATHEHVILLVTHEGLMGLDI